MPIYIITCNVSQLKTGLLLSLNFAGGLVAKLCLTLVTPWTCSSPGSSGHGISQSGLQFPSPGDLPDLGIQASLLALQADSSQRSQQGFPSLKYGKHVTQLFSASPSFNLQQDSCRRFLIERQQHLGRGGTLLKSWRDAIEVIPGGWDWVCRTELFAVIPSSFRVNSELRSEGASSFDKPGFGSCLYFFRWKAFGLPIMSAKLRAWDR